jgi:hypothetical protein
MAGKRKRDSTTPGDESEEDAVIRWEITYLNNGQPGMVQKSPFQTRNQPEGALDFTYSIKPKDQWDAMQRYNNFISKLFALFGRFHYLTAA